MCVHLIATLKNELKKGTEFSQHVSVKIRVFRVMVYRNQHFTRLYYLHLQDTMFLWSTGTHLTHNLKDCNMKLQCCENLKSFLSYLYTSRSICLSPSLRLLYLSLSQYIESKPFRQTTTIYLFNK
jgi:hypothetical protein